MTDLEKFLELYESFGIEPDVQHRDEKTHVYIYTSTSKGKTDGYTGFYTRVDFTNEGKFNTQLFFEI